MTPAECVDHMTGCARSEGYYKITMREKVKYLPHHRMKNTTTPAEKKVCVVWTHSRDNCVCVIFSCFS